MCLGNETGFWTPNEPRQPERCLSRGRGVGRGGSYQELQTSQQVARTLREPGEKRESGGLVID